MTIFHFQNLRKLSLNLVDSVKDLLPKLDIENALEAIEHNEFEVVLDTICEQLYEYDVEISPDIYEKATELSQKMKIPNDKYIFLKELIKND